MINHSSVKTVRRAFSSSLPGCWRRTRLAAMESSLFRMCLLDAETVVAALIRQQAAEQNKVYQFMLVMNGQHTEFNRLLGLGMNCFSSVRTGECIWLRRRSPRMINSRAPDKQRTSWPCPDRRGERVQGRRADLVLWGFLLRDSVISVMLWASLCITEANKPKPGGKSETESEIVFPGYQL